jgi:hypothetical protein
MNKVEIKKLALYYMTWCIPSTTPIYIILHEIYGINPIIAYLIGCLVPATIALPFNKWIIKDLPDAGLSKQLDKYD